MRSLLSQISAYVRNHLVVRTVLIIAVGVLIVSAVSAAAFHSVYRSKLLSVFETELENKKTLIEVSYAVPLWDFQERLMQSMNEAVLSAFPYMGITLFDGESEKDRQIRVASRKTAINGAPAFEHTRTPLTFDEKDVEKAVGTIIHQGRVIGFYELFYTRKHVLNHVRTSFVGLTLSFLLISVATILTLSSLLRRFVIARLFALVAFAGKVAGDQEYNRRIRIDVPDEMGDLAKSINNMLDQIERRDAEGQKVGTELKKHRDRLEEEVKERTAQLEYARDQAEAANRAKTEFLSRMSHELRTPLNAILGYAQIFLRQSLSEDLRKGAHTINDSGEHLLELINDILNLSKIESGTLELVEGVFDVRQFIEGITELMRSRAQGKGLDFQCRTDEALPAMIRADETRLRQVLLNLLTNAVKFTHEGRVTLRVMNEDAQPVSRGQAESRITLRFEVEDTGIGITEEDVSRLFQPFEQVGHSARWSEGTGLGLAISRQLARLMGGDLFVRSAPGSGSLFWFTVEVGSADRLPEREGERDGVVPIGYDGSRRRILVVDDISSNRAVLTDMLAPLGFEPDEVANGREAVDRARTHPPDLVLMDCHMPVMDGFDAAEEMKQDRALRHIPVVAVTASVMEADKAKTERSGFDAFLPKPVRLPLLVMALDRCLHPAWRYAEPPAEETGPQSEESVAPPREELAALLELVRSGDMVAIEDRAVRIGEEKPVYAAFAARLGGLARRFEDRKIREWLEKEIGDAVMEVNEP